VDIIYPLNIHLNFFVNGIMPEISFYFTALKNASKGSVNNRGTPLIAR